MNKQKVATMTSWTLANVLVWLLVAVPQGAGVGQAAAPIAHYTSYTACAEGIRFHAHSGLYTRHTLVCVPKEN